jgi:tetratricopeptide (TPR) repeat protein
MRSRSPPVPAAAAKAAAGDDEFVRATEALRPDRSLRHPRLREAAAALGDDRLDLAEPLLTEFLASHPYDASALNLMAEAATRRGRIEDAAVLLAKSVALAPDFASARYNYAVVLFQLNKAAAAMEEIEELLIRESRNPLFRTLKARVLTAMGDYEDATICCRHLSEDFPERPEVWLDYGHALRAMGLQEECSSAYRKAIALQPSLGGAYWSLANLKTFRFTDADITAMQAQLARSDLTSEDRAYLHFSLGKASDDLKQYAKAFDNYARANAIRRLGIDYDPDVLAAHVASCRRLFTPGFFHERTGAGCSAGDPIFIVGMPRSGSTLLEQILASHSAIEGTAELNDITTLARHLEESVAPTHGTDYPGILGRLDAAALVALGEQYLESTRLQRKLGRPFFTDKMPNNFLHAGMIHLMLPNATIVDIRRHPLGCCFSNFAQHFIKAQLFSYRQSDLGRCYRDYVELMAHFDRVLPGMVHRIIYEELVADPEKEVRRLLDRLGLPFEEECLQFQRNERAVRTASSEQVRVPLYKDAAEHWRNYEPWLGPLKEALGNVLDAWPAAPEFPE